MIATSVLNYGMRRSNDRDIGESLATSGFNPSAWSLFLATVTKLLIYPRALRSSIEQPDLDESYSVTPNGRADLQYGRVCTLSYRVR